MKSAKRSVSLLLTAVLILLAPMAGSITASAEEEAKTFQVKYCPEQGQWRTQCLPTWDDSRENGDLNFLYGNLSDGDSVVIIGADGAGLDITFPKSLTNLTVTGSCTVIARSQGSIRDFYVLQGATVALNNEVENACIYDNSVCNLNQNVKNLNIVGVNSMGMTVTAVGTVDCCTITDTHGNSSTIYNIQKDSLRIKDGENETDPQKYSTEPSSVPVITAPVITAPESPAGTGSEVPLSPATGGEHNALLLLAGALICLAAGFTLRKKSA